MRDNLWWAQGVCKFPVATPHSPSAPTPLLWSLGGSKSATIMKHFWYLSSALLHLEACDSFFYFCTNSAGWCVFVSRRKCQGMYMQAFYCDVMWGEKSEWKLCANVSTKGAARVNISRIAINSTYAFMNTLRRDLGFNLGIFGTDTSCCWFCSTIPGIN